jgi:hypothetical protein
MLGFFVDVTCGHRAQYIQFVHPPLTAKGRSLDCLDFWRALRNLESESVSTGSIEWSLGLVAGELRASDLVW